MAQVWKNIFSYGSLLEQKSAPASFEKSPSGLDSGISSNIYQTLQDLEIDTKFFDTDTVDPIPISM